MAKIELNQISAFMGGGSNFFNIKTNEEAVVRFLYNTASEITPYVVHEIRGVDNKFATIDCPRQEGDPLDACKYCSQGDKPVVRVILPLYNESTQQIEYWKRSGSFVTNELLPILEEAQKINKSCAGVRVKVKRSGQGLQTRYTLISQGPADDKTKDSFGPLKDPVTELKMIKEANYELSNQQQSHTQYNNQQQFTPIRRTTDMFGG